MNTHAKKLGSLHFLHASHHFIIYGGILMLSFWKCHGVGDESVLGHYKARLWTSGKNIRS
jgi:hypothetical protein